jgi:hypothetical protein
MNTTSRNHRQRHRVVIEMAVHAVRDRAVIEQRGVHLVHAGEQMIFAAHVQERLLLSREGGLRQVLGGGGGAHGHGKFASLSHSSV